MKFAYSDPPYLGCGRLYADVHPDALIWDDPDEHRRLIARMCDEFPDGWALSLHEPSLRTILNMCPDDVRTAAWVKPFAAFKANVTRAWTWEPVIFRGGRAIPRSEPTWRDHIEAPAISEPIALRRGLTGAKPEAVCEWVLDGLGFKPGDVLDDLFPGTGVMGRSVERRNGVHVQPSDGLFSRLGDVDSDACEVQP
jgi:hypothetical protein